MLKMAEPACCATCSAGRYEIIRKKVEVEGKSQRGTAKELGHARKTVAKALKHSNPPGYVRKKARKYSVLERYTKMIDSWLEEDKKIVRKQRHTARRIFDRLKEEYNYRGSYDAVQRYVKKQKKQAKERYFLLGFSAGEEAQVDWGVGVYYKNGELRKVFIFQMKMCYSGMVFVRAYERENLESFLDGHVRAFEYFGGVPRRIAYDNLKCAVTQVGRGKERRLNTKFIELRSHYLFESRFCNPGKGNEKGSVENQVKRTQRTYMTPLPRMISLAHLNEHLLENCGKELLRVSGNRNRTTGELFEEEKKMFLLLPVNKFEACKRVSTFADSQSLVRFDNNSYSVPVKWAGHPVTIKGFVDNIEIYREREKIGEHKRSYERKGNILDYRHYIELLREKPGGLFNGRMFKDEPWGKELEMMRKELEYRYGYSGTKKFINILLMMNENDVREVKEAVEKCIKMCVYDDTAVRSVLLYEPKVKTGELDLRNRPELLAVGTGKRELRIYDGLVEQES